MMLQVHLDIGKLENPKTSDPTVPLPIKVNSCFDKLEININPSLLAIMISHLEQREKPESMEEDTKFDRWIHGQVYQSEYNMI
jgi:hypothetical protein